MEEAKREKDSFFQDLAAHARAASARAAVEIDVDVQPGHPADLISRYAAEGGYDLIVLGHRGHFVRDRLLGSTTDRVAEHARVPS